MAHRTNFVVQTLSHLPMVKRIEGLLSTFYNYFYKSPKRHLEFTKLAKIMETKGAKILKNIKTQWITMLSPIKHVMVEYMILLMKMAIENPNNEKEKANFDLLCDVQVMLGLATILPLLHSIHNFIKFSQCQRDVLVCDFVVVVKECQGVIFSLYTNLSIKFKSYAFRACKTLVVARYESIIMRWVTNLTIDVEHLAFDVN
jgi:hypothetical protein